MIDSRLCAKTASAYPPDGVADSTSTPVSSGPRWCMHSNAPAMASRWRRAVAVRAEEGQESAHGGHLSTGSGRQRAGRPPDPTAGSGRYARQSDCGSRSGPRTSRTVTAQAGWRHAEPARATATTRSRTTRTSRRSSWSSCAPAGATTRSPVEPRPEARRTTPSAGPPSPRPFPGETLSSRPAPRRSGPTTPTTRSARAATSST